MTPDECRELAAQLPEDSGVRRALLMDADRQERGDTSPVVFHYVTDRRSDVGRCGAAQPTLGWDADGPCELPAGHPGWHRHGTTEWGTRNRGDS